jgi:hypothetical protein
MRRPGGDGAVVLPGKLTAYLLDMEHVRGGPKARVLRAALGIGLEQALVLERALLKAAREGDAEYLGQNEHGAAYRIEFVLEYEGRSAVIRSGWIVPADGSPTRLTTAIVRRRAS